MARGEFQDKNKPQSLHAAKSWLKTFFFGWSWCYIFPVVADDSAWADDVLAQQVEFVTDWLLMLHSPESYHICIAGLVDVLILSFG